MLDAFVQKTIKNQLLTEKDQWKLLYEWTKTDIVNFREFVQIANWIAGP
ncbi:MAG: hypothetical protein ACOC5T_04120 [Elusimicrobiota bacterium]